MAARELRRSAARAELQVIALTAGALEPGMSDFLVKSLEPAALVRTLLAQMMELDRVALCGAKGVPDARRRAVRGGHHPAGRAGVASPCASGARALAVCTPAKSNCPASHGGWHRPAERGRAVGHRRGPVHAPLREHAGRAA